MRPTVVGDLVPARNDIAAFPWPAFYGETWDKPGRLDATRFKEIKDPARGHCAKLAARERRWSGHTAGNKARLGVEVERETNDVAWHENLPVGPSLRCLRRRRRMIEKHV